MGCSGYALAEVHEHSDLSHADGIRGTPMFIVVSAAVAAAVSIAAAFAFRAVAQTLNASSQR